LSAHWLTEPLVSVIVEASDASSQRDKFKSLGKGDTSEYVMLVSPSGSVALNSPITVPIAEFSAMVRLLALISVGAEFAERTHGNRHSETTKEKQERENPARGRG